MVYEYMKMQKTSLKTFMTVKPMKQLSQMHVAGLGYQMTQHSKNDCKILLNQGDVDLRD